jgi:hypothetical protein
MRAPHLLTAVAGLAMLVASVPALGYEVADRPESDVP